jgi:hypothetical protein
MKVKLLIENMGVIISTFVFSIIFSFLGYFVVFNYLGDTQSSYLVVRGLLFGCLVGYVMGVVAGVAIKQGEEKTDHIGNLPKRLD